MQGFCLVYTYEKNGIWFVIEEQHDFAHTPIAPPINHGEFSESEAVLKIHEITGELISLKTRQQLTGE